MTDLKEAFEHDLASLPDPDLWHEIEDRVLTPRPELEPGRPWAPSDVRRRWIAGTIAAAVFLAAVLVWPVVQRDSSQPAEPAIPSVVRLTCDGSTARIDSRIVAAQPDGIHIELAQSPGQRPTNVAFYDSRTAKGPEGSGLTFSLMGRTSPTAPTEVTLRDPTSIGWLTIACTRTKSFRRLHDPMDWAGVEVVDPAGVWTSSALDCRGPGHRVGEMNLPRTVDVRGVTAKELADVLLRYTPELRPGDVVVEAGFPSDGEPLFVALRDGRAIASFWGRSIRPGPGRSYYTICYGARRDDKWKPARSLTPLIER
jgi:hypothetical protein